MRSQFSCLFALAIGLLFSYVSLHYPDYRPLPPSEDSFPYTISSILDNFLTASFQYQPFAKNGTSLPHFIISTKTKLTSI